MNNRGLTLNTVALYELSLSLNLKALYVSRLDKGHFMKKNVARQ